MSELEKEAEVEVAETAALAEHVARNVKQIGELQLDQEQRVDRHQRAVEAITAWVGRPATLYGLLALVALWIALNAVLPRLGHRPPDPAPFYWLQGVVSLLALLVATMVLITQNRQASLADKRSHLDLQMNILSEQKVAKLIALVEELRRDLPIVEDRPDPEAEAMAEATDPRAVFVALEETLKVHPPDAGAATTDAEPATEAEPRRG